MPATNSLCPPWLGCRTACSERVDGVEADRHDALRAHHCDQRRRQRPGRIRLGASVGAIGERVARLVRVQGERIPQQDGLADALQHGSYDGRGALGDRRPKGGAIKLHTAHHRRRMLETQLVGDGYARAAAAAVAEVARDPHRVDALIESFLEVAQEVAPPDARGVVAVVARAAVGGGVESRPALDARQRGDEGRGAF